MATILCISNSADQATMVGHFWTRKFAEYAVSKGHNVIFEETPTLPVLYKALLEYSPQLVVAQGHGGFKSLRVSDNILIGTKGYDKAIKRYIRDTNTDWFGRLHCIVLMLTCNAAVEVVPSLVKNGCAAAMGYRKPYVFLTDENSAPQDDQISKPFFEALFQPAIQLADGATFQQSIEATRATFKYYMQQASDKDTHKFLEFNLDNLTALGNPNAKLNSY